MTKVKQVSTVQMVAVAMLAYTRNGNVNRIKTCINGHELYPNYQLIKDHLLGNTSQLGDITTQQLEQASADIAYLQQVALMQTLKNNIPTKFIAKIVALISADTIWIGNAGIIAWMPKLVANLTAINHWRELSTRFESTSKFIGNKSDKVTVNFTLINKRYIKSKNCWSVYGHSEHGDLIFYWTCVEDKICSGGKLSGRVKLHLCDSRYNNAKVTHFNYVRILKE